MADPASLIAIEAAAKLYRLADDEGWMQQVRNFFKKKQTIIVLGSTGSGKTNLLDSLSAAAALVEPIPAISRTVALETRQVIIDERPFRIIDTRGQAAHEPARQKIYRDAMRKPPVRIINVVCYGYHEYATGSREAVSLEGVVDARHRSKMPSECVAKSKPPLPLAARSSGRAKCGHSGERRNAP